MLFESWQGQFVLHEVEGALEMKIIKLKDICGFCSFVFVP